MVGVGSQEHTKVGDVHHVVVRQPEERRERRCLVAAVAYPHIESDKRRAVIIEYARVSITSTDAKRLRGEETQLVPTTR